MNYENINYQYLSIILGVLVVALGGLGLYQESVTSELKAEVAAQKDIMSNLFEQNATMAELVCTYAKVVGGPAPEICQEG